MEKFLIAFYMYGINKKRAYSKTKMPRNFNFPNFSFLHFFHNRELSEMYISLAIRFFALSMIGLFIPVYFLYELKLSLVVVMYFFLMFAIFFGLTSIVAAYIAARIGFKHIILLSIPFQITFFLLLALLPNFKVPLIFIAAIGAFYNGLYWIGHHADLARFTKKKRRGEEVGLSFFVVGISALIGPIIGGLILTFFNFTTLFIVGSLFLLLSIVPLFMSKEFYEITPFSAKHIFEKQKLKDALAFIAQGIDIGAGGVLWPLFIFPILGAYLNLGLVGTFSAFISTFSSLIIGKVADKFGRRKLLRVGAAALASFWFFRTVVKNVVHIYFLTIFVFVGDIASLPMDTLTYTKARYSGRVVEYLVFREIFINLGKAIIYLFMMLFGSYIAAFILTGSAQALLMFFA